MRIKGLFFAMLSFVALYGCQGGCGDSCNEPRIAEIIEIDEVWAANRAFFDIKTVKGMQFIAYYGKDRSMTVASREEGSSEWTKCVMPSKLHWDTHNYVSLGIDQKGYIHVSGNMHVHPLVYFRSEKPYDISNMLELNSMIGTEEDRVTYPSFFNNHDGDLFYSYRLGSSGDGNILVNKFDPETLTWNRYVDSPIFLGVEKDQTRSAYHRCIVDDEGTFHYVWMWRWTPLVETCHQLCYVSTKDLLTWTNVNGEVVELPFYPDTDALIVDNTPTNGGLHNGKYNIIIDKDHKPFIAYLKYDEDGNTQIYLTRFKDGKWDSIKVTEWDFRWEFFGGGDQMSIGATFTLDGFSDDGYLVISWLTQGGESGYSVVDTEKFEYIKDSEVRIKPSYPESISDPITDRGFTVQNIFDTGKSSIDGVSYLLRWETEHSTHDTHAPEVMPEGPLSKLQLLKIER